MYFSAALYFCAELRVCTCLLLHQPLLSKFATGGLQSVFADPLSFHDLQLLEIPRLQSIGLLQAPPQDLFIWRALTRMQNILCPTLKSSSIPLRPESL